MNEPLKHIRPLSYRQGRAIDLWISGGCKSKAQAILGAGYGESIAHQPHKVFGIPVVVDELDKRGYNPMGTCLPVQAIDLAENWEPEQPLIDFSMLTTEKLQLLKERLAEIPEYPDLFVRREEAISFTSATATIAVDQAQQDTARRNPSSL